MENQNPQETPSPLAQTLPKTNGEYPTLPIDDFKKRSFFSFKNLFSIFLLVLILAAIAYAFFNREKYIQMASNSIVLPTQPPPSPTLNPTLNWQKKDLGIFSFMYPDGWYINDQSKTFYIFPAGKSLDEILHDEEGYYFTIDEIPNPKNQSVQKYWEDYVKLNGRRNPEFEPVTIAGLDGIKTENNGLDHFDTTYFISGNSVIYRVSLVRFYMKDDITAQGDTDQQFLFVKSQFSEADTIFDEILKSFSIKAQ